MDRDDTQDTIQILTSTLKLLHDCNEGTDEEIEEAIEMGTTWLENAPRSK
tara:strand:+ start:1238 stop:1387 length:150 start_codon:yes stop_codon:yes gene_type:complete